MSSVLAVSIQLRAAVSRRNPAADRQAVFARHASNQAPQGLAVRSEYRLYSGPNRGDSIDTRKPLFCR